MRKHQMIPCLILISLVKNSTDILILTGKNHKLKCDGSYKFYSDLTYSNSQYPTLYVFGSYFKNNK